MMRLTHKFVQSAPDQLENGVLYVSLEYCSVLHKCCCGCGTEIMTRLSPKDWKLTFDGETISLYPSIGNWKLKCQSHYWINKSQVEWATKWSPEKIKTVDKAQTEENLAYYAGEASTQTPANKKRNPDRQKKDVKEKIKGFFRKR